MKINRSVVTGVAVGVILVGGAAFALASPHLTGSSTHEMRIQFQSADGLVSGSDVLEAGTKIGQISDIQPTQSNSALVTIQVEGDHWPVHQGVTADIRPKSLLGEKYVDLHDGPQNASAYDVSATLQTSNKADPVELDQFINSLDAPTRTAIRVLLDDLGAGVAGRGPDLNTAIAAGRANLANLAVFGKTLNDRDPDLDKILVGLDGVLAKITTNDQLNQMSQLITNGQNTLNDIESVQTAFSRGFTDANIALSDLNTAFDGAASSLHATLDVAPSLVANLTQESNLLAGLGSLVNTKNNLSPNGECVNAQGGNPGTTANQPITSITGLTQCSPVWEIIKGLLGGPTNTGGALEGTPQGGIPNPVFRVCVNFAQVDPNLIHDCKNSSAGSAPPSGAAAGGYMSSDGAMFAALLGT